MGEKNTHTRRRAVQTTGIALGGILGGVRLTGTATACSTYNGCSKTSENNVTDHPYGQGVEHHLGSGIDRYSVNYGDDWDHYFRLAGSGVSIENGERSENYGATSQKTALRNYDEDSLSLLTSKNPDEAGFGPTSDEDDTGNDGELVLNAATTALEIAAEAAGVTAGALALTAADIVGIVYDLLLSQYDGNVPVTYEYLGEYTQPISDGGHHLKWITRQKDFTDSEMKVTSQFGYAINEWDLSFLDRGVTITPEGEIQKTDHEWKPVDRMRAEERKFFGIDKVRYDELPRYVRKEVPSSKSAVYVANNPPITLESVSDN
jgi:hypothetical protein